MKKLKNTTIACVIVILGMLTSPLTGFAETSKVLQDKYTLKGKVSSEEDGESLPGVTVLVRGTATGSVTDLDGNFSVQVSDEDVLVLSFVGFKTQEIPVNGQTSIDVVMKLDIEALEEVVVVGYGEQSKETLTGAVISVETKELDEIPTGNLAQGLIGKLAGVQVNRNGTGIPGTNTPLVIREESASSLQRQVLYVIDGVVYSDNDFHAVPGPSGSEVFNRLDPSEIESISILKDGAAAVYGARAAGGVVIVKTKRGQAGKIKFTYNGSAGIGQPTQIPEMLTGEQHAMLWNEIVRLQDSLEGRTPFQVFDSADMAIIRSREYDWLDGLYKASYNQRHALSASGGSEDVTYFFGGSYYHETGNYDDLWYKRYSFRTNIEYEVTNNLSFGVGLNFSQGNRKNPNYDPESGNVQEGVLREWYKRPLTAARWVPPTVDGVAVSNGSWNPYGLLQSENYRTSSSDNSNIRAQLEYKVPFIEGLKFNAMGSYNINTSYSTRYGQDYLTYAYFNDLGTEADDTSAVLVPNSEGLMETFNRGKVYQLNFSTNYKKTLGRHNFGAMLAYEQQEGVSRGFRGGRENANIKGFDYFWAFQQGSNSVEGDYSISGRWGVIGRFNYDFDGKYLFETNFRAEKSNKFHPDERFGIFPSISAGWILSEESFFKNNVSAVDFLKIRSSLGITGNDGNSAPSEWKPTFEAQDGGAIFGRGNGVVVNSIKAKNDGFYVPSRTWAKTRNFNLGMDLVTFDQKLQVTAEYYYTLIYDAFDRRQDYPFVLGNGKPPLENYKKSYSEGFELQIEYSDRINKDMPYSVYGNISKRRSRPLKLYQNPAVLGTWVDQLRNDDSNQPGYFALGIIRDEEHLEEVLAMYPNQPKVWVQSVQDSLPALNGIPISPGMIYYKDIGGPNYSRVPDGKINSDDRGIIAEYTTPPYSYGFGFSIGYKAFKLRAAFAGAFGHKEFIEKDEQVVNTGSDQVINQTQNTFAWWGDYWTENNTDASMPRPYKYGYAGEVSTFWMRNGHTLRLNDISLSYTMPERINKKLGLSNLKFYASATNVWTIISPFDFKDPAVSRAFDYPLVRMVNTGLSFTM